MLSGLSHQLTNKLTTLELSMLSHILNGISICDIVNLTNLSAQEIRFVIASLYKKIDDNILDQDLGKIHLLFKLTKQKRRFLI